ncbi:MAG TPA: Hint domain-containing protein [Anaerolineales bacterium]|nr:Hint domain-containing protein [Anaerolineales bacterium]
MKKLIAFTFALFLAACSFLPSGSSISTPISITAEVSTVIAETPGTLPTDGPSLTPVPSTFIPTLPSGFSPTELKYRVLDEYPDFFFCDPDYYPVAREDEMVLAQQRFPELQADQEEFQAILEHNGLGGSTTFTDEQKLLIYHEHKKLNAIYFQLVEDKYQFQIQTGSEGQQGTIVSATIDGSGSIDELQREPGFPSCPICLAAETLIDTPRGAVRVEDLRVGDPVWTQDEAGQRVPASILKTGHARVPADHPMIHILLSDGRELSASAGHPTTDGRSLGDLEIGDILDGTMIVELERELYDETHTFDILPSGATGYYWANRILIDSTLSFP